jgi:hypothetical protein
MATTRHDIEILPPERRARGGHRTASDRRARIARLDKLADLLDTAFTVPGTGIRFGVDSLIGLIPGIGDVATSALGLWIVYEGHQLGAHKHVVARMLGNVAVDATVGAVPLAGDAFDVIWKANRRNLRILREHLARRGLD